MVVLDGTTVITALPSMQRDLGLSTTAVQWVVTIYGLTYGGLMLLGGRLSDVLGNRPMFGAGTLIFTAASLLCGLASSGNALITGRFLQGLGAALVTPSALSILLNTFRDSAARNKALGVWSAVASIGGIAGFLDRRPTDRRTGMAVDLLHEPTYGCRYPGSDSGVGEEQSRPQQKTCLHRCVGNHQHYRILSGFYLCSLGGAQCRVDRRPNTSSY